MLCVNFGFHFHFGGKSKFSAITKKWAEKKNKKKVKVDSHIFTLRRANFSFFSFLFFRVFALKREVTCRKERQKNRPHRVVSSFLSICGVGRACGGSS